MRPTGDVTEDRIIRGMVGRDMTHRFPPRESNIGEVLLEVKNWKVRHPVYDDRMVINDVSINVRAGEVVGIAGLMGAGRTEFAMSVFGRSWGHFVSGQVLKHGEEIDVSTIPKAVANGLAYATEDRKTYGLVLMNDVKTNVTMANLPGVSNRGVLIPPKEITVANEYRNALNIKTPSVKQITVNLSGGNQQKVVLVEVAVRQPGRADPRRADARHRRRREVRDLHDHQPPRRGGKGDHHHLVRAARRCWGCRTGSTSWPPGGSPPRCLPPRRRRSRS